MADALFPVGDLKKPEVRRIAEEIGLPTAHKKDSQGLCFVGKVKLPEFLQQQLEVQEGPILKYLQMSSPVLTPGLRPEFKRRMPCASAPTRVPTSSPLDNVD